MQSFLGGADCAANANPLSGMMKREGVDRSVLRDRTDSPVAGSSRTSDPGFRATPLQGGFTPRQHAPSPVQQQQGQQQSFERAFANAMTLSQQQQGPAGPSMLMRSQAPPPMTMAPVPSGFSPQMQGPGPMQQQQQHGWGGDFQAFVEGKGKSREAPPQQVMQQMQQGSAMSQGRSNNPHKKPIVDTAKLDAEFERALAEHQELEAAQKDAVQDDGELQSALAQQSEQRDGDGQPDFEAVWQSLKPEADRLGKLAEWEKEFSQARPLPSLSHIPLLEFANGQQDDELDYDFNPDMTGAVQEPSFGVNGRTVGEDGYPLLGDYEFAQENPHVNDQHSLKQALHILSTGGSLTEVALLLEATLSSGTAAAQASQLSEGGGQTLLAGGEAAVWTLLGQTQAMDEKETSAVRALEEGRKRFEAERGRSELADRTFGEGLVSLAISYTNESYDYSALLALHRYLSLLHPSYAGPVPSSDLEVDMLDPETHDIPNPWHANQRLTESYLALARDQITAGVVDADVQVGLGVLYYQTGEFERARDCWVAALGVRPTDFQLWNRLGATLANSGSPEEAIDAYRRALELKPSFTRAIYNLGVSCLNIGVYQEAAEHLLAGLALHTVDASAVPSAKLGNGADSPDHSTTLWTTLRRERPDLVDMAKPGTDLAVFRQAGFEF
ncbi:hypothetical protein QFC20_007720 [Naganishia adeliensis]|uniref:Uncharacterized protein n=1 Tax=Naganishia adeliensis TaxID=92952 RepID=A0ACC2UW28_9TREE|nr:hypothetical protein QFC20_007720 [Naganishia adeliensis]